MDIGRRDFIFMAGMAAVGTGIGVPAWGALGIPRGAREMFGLIGKMTAVPGQRDALIAILLEGVAEMPGCHSYIVAKDPSDANAIWITEVWDSKASHEASLSLPAVREAITRGKPLIAGFGDSFITTPVGGHGLVSAKTP
jgi:quinol monooxygenase YgiN